MSLNTLTHLTLLKVTGSDSKNFLQGQLTNDINALGETWHFSAYCNPKGRALANFIAWESSDAIFLLCEKSLMEAVLKRLRMYVMRSDVIFEEVEASIVGTYDFTDLQFLETQVSKEFENYSYRLEDGVHILGFGDRALLVLPDDNGLLDNKISDDLSWLKQDIADGLPRVTVESQEMFIPQMLNLDILDGVNFKKGCYTGQEIIARMRYLGKLKQRSFVCELSNNCTVEIGAKIIDENGKNIGSIVNAVDGHDAVVASLRFDNLDNGLILESGETLSVKNNQPYSIDTTNS